ncbi:hypothetical protein RQN30_03735 [Arcanobacterium hippocoleae]
MSTILTEIADFARERVAQAKNKMPQSVLERLSSELGTANFGFEKALAGPDLAFICECKRHLLRKG